MEKWVYGFFGWAATVGVKQFEGLQGAGTKIAFDYSFGLPVGL